MKLHLSKTISPGETCCWIAENSGKHTGARIDSERWKLIGSLYLTNFIACVVVYTKYHNLTI